MKMHILDVTINGARKTAEIIGPRAVACVRNVAVNYGGALLAFLFVFALYTVGNNAHAVVTLPTAITALDLGDYVDAMLGWVFLALGAILLGMISIKAFRMAGKALGLL